MPSKHDDGSPIPAEWKLTCLQCGYDLTGLAGRICPECGTQFSPRKTWEGNRAGVMPKTGRHDSDWGTKVQLLIGGFAVGLIALAYLPRGLSVFRRASAVVAAVVIVGGEFWIHFTSVSPRVVRIVVGCICVLIAMLVFIQ